MDPTIPTPTVCSTVSNSEVSMQAPPPSPLYILDISLISAQDLTPVSKSMRTYAIAWTNPSRKLTTRTDQHGHTHPTWNEKLTFRVDGHFLTSEDATIHIEIYSTASWFREVLVGSVRVLVSDLLYPDPLQTRRMRFVTLQVRRPSGAPQGILNMGVSLSGSGDEFRNAIEQKVNALSLEDRADDDNDNERKVTLWRSLSVGSEANPGSVVNGGSELCSDIGPSASIVAADLARKCQPPQQQQQQQQPMIRRPSGYEDTGSSILGEMTMEEAKAKGYRVRSSRERWRKQVSKRDYGDMDDDRSDLSSNCNEQSRRKSDGGMFSCFGTAYGIEFRIVCGAPNNPTTKRLPSSSSNNNSASKRNIKPSTEANSA
ncbi:hypothetical protein CASFOL_023967 [Castilleja foliolosa]|uniref:C2 domain-containing protein n=1 Tax=Castilleja foliolosa TaxID=1961234 RepID=A0ABD3CLZ3_9LAMI